MHTISTLAKVSSYLAKDFYRRKIIGKFYSASASVLKILKNVWIQNWRIGQKLKADAHVGSECLISFFQIKEQKKSAP